MYLQAQRKSSPMEEDEIDEAANNFETKVDGQKGSKNWKGHHLDKVGCMYMLCMLSTQFLSRILPAANHQVERCVRCAPRHI